MCTSLSLCNTFLTSPSLPLEQIHFTLRPSTITTDLSPACSSWSCAGSRLVLSPGHVHFAYWQPGRSHLFASSLATLNSDENQHFWCPLTTLLPALQPPSPCCRPNLTPTLQAKFCALLRALCLSPRVQSWRRLPSTRFEVFSRFCTLSHPLFAPYRCCKKTVLNKSYSVLINSTARSRSRPLLDNCPPAPSWMSARYTVTVPGRRFPERSSNAMGRRSSSCARRLLV